MVSKNWVFIVFIIMQAVVVSHSEYMTGGDSRIQVAEAEIDKILANNMQSGVSKTERLVIDLNMILRRRLFGRSERVICPLGAGEFFILNSSFHSVTTSSKFNATETVSMKNTGIVSYLEIVLRKPLNHFAEMFQGQVSGVTALYLQSFTSSNDSHSNDSALMFSNFSCGSEGDQICCQPVVKNKTTRLENNDFASYVMNTLPYCATLHKMTMPIAVRQKIIVWHRPLNEKEISINERKKTGRKEAEEEIQRVLSLEAVTDNDFTMHIKSTVYVKDHVIVDPYPEDPTCFIPLNMYFFQTPQVAVHYGTFPNSSVNVTVETMSSTVLMTDIIKPSIIAFVNERPSIVWGETSMYMIDQETNQGYMKNLQFKCLDEFGTYSCFPEPSYIDTVTKSTIPQYIFNNFEYCETINMMKRTFDMEIVVRMFSSN